MKQALWFSSRARQELRCELCPHLCTLKEGSLGLCGVRFNKGGKLYTHLEAEATVLAVEGIEKKPLYHFLPGARVLSVGSRGCTLSCDYCRNWSISQQLNVPRKALSPSELIKIAQEKGVQGICFTYNEPFLWYEYLKECLPLCRQAGFATLIKTGGYIELEPVKALLPWISAVNLDIKGFSEAFYQKICKGSLAPVLALALLLKKEVPLELSYLLVPGENEKELFPFAKWVQENLGSWTPLHLGAFFPAHRLKDRVQSRESEVCEAFLRLKADFPFVYASSFFTKSASENSFCPSCGVLLVERNKQEVRSFLKEPLCFSCKKELPFSLSFSASSNEIETYVSKAY